MLGKKFGINNSDILRLCTNDSILDLPVEVMEGLYATPLYKIDTAHVKWLIEWLTKALEKSCKSCNGYNIPSWADGLITCKCCGKIMVGK